jgi:hypothetical protein
MEKSAAFGVIRMQIESVSVLGGPPWHGVVITQGSSVGNQSKALSK